jgi:hypothetical protein
MSSRKENDPWKEAEAAEDRGFRPTKAAGGRRKAPFYKVLEGMPIAVDAFRYGAIPGVTSYFLTYAYPFTIYALTALTVHLCPGTHIQTITQICHQVGRQVQFTARVLSEWPFAGLEPDNFMQRALLI